MANIKLDTTLNIPTIISIIGGIIGIVVYISNVKTTAEISKSDIVTLKQEMTELRQLHMVNKKMLIETDNKLQANITQVSKVKAIAKKSEQAIKSVQKGQTLNEILKEPADKADSSNNK